MANVIEVYRWTKGEILAHYIGPHAAEIERVFGTTCIPTPFHCDSGISDQESDRRILNAVRVIQQNNPTVTVRPKYPMQAL